MSAPGEEGGLVLEALNEVVVEGLDASAGARSTAAAFHDHCGHLHQLHRRLAILQGLVQVQDLTSHDRHLLLKKVLVETWVLREQGMKFITHLLHKVHVRQLWQN